MPIYTITLTQPLVDYLNKKTGEIISLNRMKKMTIEISDGAPELTVDNFTEMYERGLLTRLIEEEPINVADEIEKIGVECEEVCC